MQTEKVFSYIILENKGHYETYSNMKELLQSYELPLAALKDIEQLQVHFDKLSSHYYVPPQQSYAEFFQGHRQELMEQLAENNQDMSRFNQSMSHDLLAFVKSYNSCVTNMLLSQDSQSPGCVRSMRDSMKHLLQEKQDLEMEKETLEEEIVIMSMKNHKAEVREECAQRDKDNLQVNLQSAQELIGELRERNCYLEKKLKKKSLLKRVTRHLFQNKNPPRVSRNHSGIQVVHWNQDMHVRLGDTEMINEAKNSNQDLENIDADLKNSDEDVDNIDEDVENTDEDMENSDEDLENSYADLENSEEDLENSDASLENSDEDLENTDADLENSEEDLENTADLENSEEDPENIDAGLENIDAGLENIEERVDNEKEEKTLRTSKGTEEAVPQRSAWQNFIRYIKPKKEKWSSKTPKTKTDVWRRIQSCMVKSQNSSVNNVQFQKLTASLSTERP